MDLQSLLTEALTRGSSKKMLWMDKESSVGHMAMNIKVTSETDKWMAKAYSNIQMAQVYSMETLRETSSRR